MKKTFLVFFLFLSIASALQVTPLKKQVILSPCDQAVFPFEVNGEGPVSLEIKGKNPTLNYSFPSSLSLRDSTVVDVTVLYPCDASLAANNYAFTLSAKQGSKAAAATAYVATSPTSSLWVSLTSEGLACSCSSSRFGLEIKNTGKKRESGTILVSSQFPFSISGTSFDLEPGEIVSKIISLDIGCSTPAGAYPLSVALVKKNGGVSQHYSVVSTAQCFASQLQGPSEVTFCHSDPINITYTLFNTGNVAQDYLISTTFGEASVSNASISPHSSLPFNVSIANSLVSIPGDYNFSVKAKWSKGVAVLPVSLSTKLCSGLPVPLLEISYTAISINNSIQVKAGANNLVISITNPNNFSIKNAVLSLVGLGPVSDFFTLLPNETKQVPVLVNIPSNFQTTDAILMLESDQGEHGQVVKIVKTTPLAGFFVVGNFVSNTHVIAIVVALTLLVMLFYYAESQRRKQIIIDVHVSNELKKVLAKYRR